MTAICNYFVRWSKRSYLLVI